jgi:hypothetical protein
MDGINIYVSSSTGGYPGEEARSSTALTVWLRLWRTFGISPMDWVSVVCKNHPSVNRAITPPVTFLVDKDL